MVRNSSGGLAKIDCFGSSITSSSFTSDHHFWYYIEIGNVLHRFFEDISISRTNSNETYRPQKID